MNRSILLLVVLCSLKVHAQRSCGYQQQFDVLEKQSPAFRQWANEEYKRLQLTEERNITAGKTTAIAAIPVIFHVVIDTGRYNLIGGYDGIRKRCDSQIAVLNRDYNRANPDSSLIPYGWKPYYKSVGIRFGLAHTDPTGHSTPGFDIRITNKAFTEGGYYDYGNVKRTDSGGISGWDPDKYLNIWCLFFSDNTRLLGVTTPYDFSSGAAGTLPPWHRGICVAFNAFGKRTAASDNYASGVFDQGRTLTHECGHYFGMRHTWGDDAGSCPWSSGGSDDGISDTSPEGNATYGNPTYDTSIPGGTIYDGCRFNGTTLMQPIGIPCLNYMDYTDDKAMHMFTTLQASYMASTTLTASGANYTLTQHPELLDYPASVTTVNNSESFSIYPNPTNGSFDIQYLNANSTPYDISITDALGKIVLRNTTISESNYHVDLTNVSPGVYYVVCNFVSGTVARKIVIQ